jgi:tellurite resistance protein TerC
VLVFWIAFNIFVVALLALDLGVLQRQPHRVGLREALAWAGFSIALAAGFAVLVLFWQGRAPALQFVTAYVIELSLSVDNLFVFLVIFRYFNVPRQHQHKVLFWGIIGALMTRGVFIVAGVGLMRRLHWIPYAFGALLVYSGIRLLRAGKMDIHPEKNLGLRLFRRILPVKEQYLGGQFFGRDGAFYATPLLLVLLMVETSDILFAVDSIPAVLGITADAFILYTSNVFAVLGLRSMYFALAGTMDLFHYLHYGLSVILIFVGFKMLGSHYLKISTGWSLVAVLLVLAISVLASLWSSENKVSS